MKSVYVLKYICIVDDSEQLIKFNFNILGVYSTKEEAVEELLIRANYREKDGKLTQYKKFTDEYPSLEYLRNKVKNEMCLEDEDIYEIEKCVLNEKSKERIGAANKN